MKPRPWPTPKPTKDKRLVGITFVDVLFALVIGEILRPLADWRSIPKVGLVHLSVAAVLTLTSWIGYHNSWNRPKYFIRFPNLPLFQFLIDVALVVVYWFSATSAEGTQDGVPWAPSARPETLLVTAAFVFYVLWDLVGHRMRVNSDYTALVEREDHPRRRHVTWVFAVLSTAVAGIVLCRNPRSDTDVIVIDAALIVLLVGFRFAKEYFGDRPPESGPKDDDD